MVSDQQVPLLLTAAELAARLDDPGVIVIDCRFDLQQPEAGEAAWRAGHIPGARYAHLDQDLASQRVPGSGRHPLPEPAAFARTLGCWGVTPTHHVVLYDAAGGALAARLWWLLRWVGHGRVTLLDGGLPAWEAAGGKLDAGALEGPAVAPYPVAPGQMPVVSAAEVAAALTAAPPGLLLDARDAARFAGAAEPIDPVAGHVPGAVNWPFQNNLGDGQQFLPIAELRAALADVLSGSAAAEPQAVMSMCGSGVTACHNLFALELSGLTSELPAYPALYVGSWSEWIVAPERAVATASTA